MPKQSNAPLLEEPQTEDVEEREGEEAGLAVNVLDKLPEQEATETCRADPALDPADPKFNPDLYFSLQPKVVVVVTRDEGDIARDPENRITVYMPVSINGYPLTTKTKDDKGKVHKHNGIPMGKVVEIPRDFADFLVEIGRAQTITQLR